MSEDPRDRLDPKTRAAAKAAAATAPPLSEAQVALLRANGFPTKALKAAS